MKRIIKDMAEEILQDFTNCYNEEDEEYLAKMLETFASDVAREIFEEIEDGVKAAVSALQFENNPIHRKVKHETYSSLMRFIKTVEQKYTENKGEH